MSKNDYSIFASCGFLRVYRRPEGCATRTQIGSIAGPDAYEKAQERIAIDLAERIASANRLANYVNEQNAALANFSRP